MVSSVAVVEKSRNLLQLPTLDVDEGLCSLDDIDDIA